MGSRSGREVKDPNVTDAATDQAGYTCLLAGATGLVGSALLVQLMENPKVKEITVLTRRPLDFLDTRRAHHSSKLKVIITLFDDVDQTLEDVNADVVFCTLGTTIKVAKTQEAFREVDYEYPLALARWAKRSGASHYAVITAMGASTASKFFYSRVKGELEESLASLKLPMVHIFQPSLLLGQRRNMRMGESIGAWAFKGLQFTMVGPFRKYRPIKGEDVARGMIQAVSQSMLRKFTQSTNQAASVKYYQSHEIANLALQSTR